jgi:hypothetical protein
MTQRASAWVTTRSSRRSRLRPRAPQPRHRRGVGAECSCSTTRTRTSHRTFHPKHASSRGSAARRKPIGARRPTYSCVGLSAVPDAETWARRVRGWPLRHTVDVRGGLRERSVGRHLLVTRSSPRRSLLHPSRLDEKPHAVSNRTPFTTTEPSCCGSSMTTPVYVCAAITALSAA